MRWRRACTRCSATASRPRASARRRAARSRTGRVHLRAALDEMRQRSAIAVAAILCITVSTQSPPNVLLITIDTVRADHIGAYGYAGGATPVLDRLAREGARFTDATSQAPLTAPAQ